MSRFKQQRLAERERELEAANDDTAAELADVGELSRGAATLVNEEREFSFDVRGERLFAPHNADAPRGEHAPTADVQTVEFDMMTEAEIRARSVTLVNTTFLFKKLGDGSLQPDENGLLSERMGPIERDRVCWACEGSRETPSYLAQCGERYMCDGHFGHIELSGALFQPEMVDVLMSALRCFCWECGELPGDDEQNRRVVRALSTPDAQGRLKNRAERLAVLSTTYGKRLTCAQCFKDEEKRANVRCQRCPIYCATRNHLDAQQRAAGVTIKHPVDANGQCPLCESPTQFRATITKLHRRPFNGFPYLIHWQMPKRQGWAGVRRTGVLDINGEEICEPQTKVARDAELFDNYCDRESITQREMEMSPERARVIIERMGHTPALLLAADGTYHNAATGEVDNVRYSQQQLRTAFRASIEWLESMAPRVLPVAPNVVRQTDVSAGLAKSRLNELTTGYIDLMRADGRLRATQLSSNEAERAREDARTNGILRFPAGKKWHWQAPSDAVAVGQVAELYGRVQYYYALMARATKAPFWLPTENRAIKVPDKARKGAERTKNKGRGFISDLGGKEGFMRKDLEGSRCDFSFRSVIVPDPRMPIDACGITRETAERLSVPVQLFAVNIEHVLRRAEKLRLAVRARGRLATSLMIFNEEHTTAIRYLESADKTVYECELARIGSWIELPLDEGDIVVMNRQPSLHKPSMMAHFVHLLPDDDAPLTTSHDDRRATDEAYRDSTICDPPFRRSVRTGPAIRLHPDAVGTYNADFDGDEMTVHVPQSMAARVEAMQLMAVQQNMLSTKNGRAQIMPRQNHLLALNLMTKEERFIEKGEFFNILMATLPAGSDAFSRIPRPAIVRPRELWTARQLISLILPPNLTVSRGDLDSKTLQHTDDIEKTPALIVRGWFHYGIVDKDLSSRIIAAIYMAAAPTSVATDDVRGQAPMQCTNNTKLYVGAVSELTESWLETWSGSMGIEDMMTDVALRGGAGRPKCEACTADPSRSRAMRSCVRCRLDCKSCAALRAHFQSKGKPFDINTQSCGECYGAGKLDKRCPLHKCATLLPRCGACREVTTCVPTFSTHNVPDSVRDTERYPCDRALRRRLGPVKFAAWDAVRARVPELADGISRQQRAWAKRLGPRVADDVAEIDRFEKLVVDSYETEFEQAGGDARLALPAHAQRHSNELAHWQRIGPTKYAIEKRLSRVESDVAAIVEKKRAMFKKEHALHRYRTVDNRIDEIEGEIRKELGKARNETHRMAYENLPRGNNLRDVIEAQTKGNKTNVGTVMACVGQQEIDGARLVDRVIGLEGGPLTSVRLLAQPLRRYLPHDQMGVYPGAVAGGFGGESLLDGVNPRTFWMMAEASRDSLINTAIRTAPVGYMTRKVCKTTEGVLIAGDGTVRNSDNSIVAQRYGAGYSVQFMSTKVLPPLTMSDAELRASVLLDAERDACTHDHTGKPTAERRSLVWLETRKLRESLDYLRSFGLVDRENVDSVRTVNDIERLLVEATTSGDGACPRTAASTCLGFKRCASPCWNACSVDEIERMRAWRQRVYELQRAYFSATERKPRDEEQRLEYARAAAAVDPGLLLMDECDVIAAVDEWLTPRARCTHEHCAEQHRHLEHCDDITRAELRLRLSAKQLVRRHAISRPSLLYFMESYAGWLRRATVVCGDAVAIDACQSFTSENMQGTLSSFHHAGATAVVVSEGMPRSLETLGARSTAKMATPKVVAHLPGGGFAARHATSGTKHIVELICPADARAYADAWRELGRETLTASLVKLSHRRPSTKLPELEQPRCNRKRAHAAREAEFADELSAAKRERREEFATLLGEALDVCAAGAKQHCGNTLGSLLCNWRQAKLVAPATGDDDFALRADVAPGNPFVTFAPAYIELLVRHSMWSALAPLVGRKRLCTVEPTFDARTEHWTGVVFRYVVSEQSRGNEARRADARTLFTELRDSASETYVFCPDRLKVEAMELFDERYAGLLEKLTLPQTTLRNAVLRDDVGEVSDCGQTAVYDYDEVLSSAHRAGLVRPAFTELINSVSILYAPLVPSADNPNELRVRDKQPNGEPLFSDDIETFYRQQSANNEIGCTHCRDGSDARLFDVNGRPATSSARPMHARCDPDVRCLSSFVLELRLASRGELALAYYPQIESMLCEALGHDHSIIMGQPGAPDEKKAVPDTVVHVRLHVCGLDRLTQRVDMNHHHDFCRPLLDEKLMSEYVETADDPGGDEPAPRARRTKAAIAAAAAAALATENGGSGGSGVPGSNNGLTVIEEPALEKHLRRHIQRVLIGETTRLVRNTAPRRDLQTLVVRELPSHIYSFENDAQAVIRTVYDRLDARQAARQAGTLRDTTKHQLTECGKPPTKEIYRDTGVPLISPVPMDNIDPLANVEDDTDIVSKFKFSIAVESKTPDGHVQIERVERTYEELQADESEQIKTQVEIAELHRSLEIIKRLRLGTVDAEARNMCVERTPHFVVLPDRGAVRRVTPSVALDSRNFLRVISERFVDHRRSTTNAIADIEQVLGKMAARNKTATELNAIVRAANATVDRSHLALLASVQWARGWCMPFTVHGLKYASDDVFQQMSFETTAVMLRDAVARRAVNSVISPSTCIAFGVAVRRLGTSAIDLRFDPSAPIDERAYGEQESAESFAARNIFEKEIAAVSSGRNVNPFARMPNLEPFYAYGAYAGEGSPSHNISGDIEFADQSDARIFGNDPLFASIDPSGTNMFEHVAACFSPVRNADGMMSADNSDGEEDIFADVHASYQQLLAHNTKQLGMETQYDPTSPAYDAPARVEEYDPTRPQINTSMAPPPARVPVMRAAVGHMYAHMLMAHDDFVADNLSFLNR